MRKIYFGSLSWIIHIRRLQNLTIVLYLTKLWATEIKVSSKCRQKNFQSFIIDPNIRFFHNVVRFKFSLNFEIFLWINIIYFNNNNKFQLLIFFAKIFVTIHIFRLWFKQKLISFQLSEVDQSATIKKISKILNNILFKI